MGECSPGEMAGLCHLEEIKAAFLAFSFIDCPHQQSIGSSGIDLVVGRSERSDLRRFDRTH